MAAVAAFVEGCVMMMGHWLWLRVSGNLPPPSDALRPPLAPLQPPLVALQVPFNCAPNRELATGRPALCSKSSDSTQATPGLARPPVSLGPTASR